jgi:2-polyprenyl-3-methyl-5-hydroxy-6-metoxy-1,4-benzoquinol methylase
MDSVPKEMFASMYAGQAPWDVGKPQPVFIAIADRVSGNVLDAGCGTGDHSIYFASRGCTVTGVDFLDEATERGKRPRGRISRSRFSSRMLST